MQSLSCCHRCRGHVSTPGKHNQETAILAGSHMLACTPSKGRDTLGHEHPQGAPHWAGVCGLFLPVPALDGTWASKRFSPGHTPQGQDQSRAPAQGCPDQGIWGSLRSSWGWQRADPCNSICQQHLHQGGREMRAGRRHISIHEGGQLGWEGCRAPCSPVPNLKPPLRSTGTAQTPCSLCP